MICKLSIHLSFTEKEKYRKYQLTKLIFYRNLNKHLMLIQINEFSFHSSNFQDINTKKQSHKKHFSVFI